MRVSDQLLLSCLRTSVRPGRTPAVHCRGQRTWPNKKPPSIRGRGPIAGRVVVPPHFAPLGAFVGPGGRRLKSRLNGLAATKSAYADSHPEPLRASGRIPWPATTDRSRFAPVCRPAQGCLAEDHGGGARSIHRLRSGCAALYSPISRPRAPHRRHCILLLIACKYSTPPRAAQVRSSKRPISKEREDAANRTLPAI
jgi:hypothetical protein